MRGKVAITNIKSIYADFINLHKMEDREACIWKRFTICSSNDLFWVLKIQMQSFVMFRTSFSFTLNVVPISISYKNW